MQRELQEAAAFEEAAAARDLVRRLSAVSAGTSRLLCDWLYGETDLQTAATSAAAAVDSLVTLYYYQPAPPAAAAAPLGAASLNWAPLAAMA